jgi:hypothetical protein
MSGFEYRVVWQREGFAGKKRKLFGSPAGAERWVKRLRGELTLVEGDPDDYACCSGYECGCHGKTIAQAREEEREHYARLPAVVFGPVIERRPVGAWEVSST